MLTIGEFSNICKVSTKTLRYYAEIGLIIPDEINPDTGYRYYSTDQLETMLLIIRLKSYSLSLEEIKTVLESKATQEETLYHMLARKKEEIASQIQKFEQALDRLNSDMSNLKHGKSIMSYLDDIEIELAEVPKIHIISVRKMVHKYDFEKEYTKCFRQLINKINDCKLTMQPSPMTLFHSSEFSPLGLDTEFAIPVKEYAKGTRDFSPGLCLKTVLHGSYSNLPSVYAMQKKFAINNGYENSNALYEVYVTDPSQVSDENELITEIYYPVKKV